MIFCNPTSGGDGPMIITPAKYGVPTPLKNGRPWCADNEAFTIGFDPDRFFPWLKKLEPYRDKCMFVAVPDVVGNSIATLELYREWVWHFEGWPVAFVAQDGQENLPLPEYYDCLFVGGSTEWKVSDAAVSVIKRAQADMKRIHIGRVNWKKRYDYFNLIWGSEVWTCDGNRARYEGEDKTYAAWRGYMAQKPLLRL